MKSFPAEALRDTAHHVDSVEEDIKSKLNSSLFDDPEKLVLTDVFSKRMAFIAT